MEVMLILIYRVFSHNVDLAEMAHDRLDWSTWQTFVSQSALNGDGIDRLEVQSWCEARTQSYATDFRLHSRASASLLNSVTFNFYKDSLIT